MLLADAFIQSNKRRVDNQPCGPAGNQTLSALEAGMLTATP